MLDAQIMHLLQSIDSADAPVTDGAKARLADLAADWKVIVAEYDRIVKDEIAGFNALLREAGVNPVVPP
jgi:hypothetical protein